MANARKKLQILGDGNCLYNSFAVAMCYQFLAEGENGHWHQWLQSKKADQFWGIFARDNQLGNDRIAAFKTILQTKDWVERQRLLAEVLRVWNANIMFQKSGVNAELRQGIADSYRDHIFIASFKNAISDLFLPESSNQTLFDIVLKRVSNNLAHELGDDFALTVAKAMLTPHKDELNAGLRVLRQEQQRRVLLDGQIQGCKDRNEVVTEGLSKQFHEAAEQYSAHSEKMIETLRESDAVTRWFNNAHNISYIQEALGKSGHNAGTDELVFLAEATGVDLKLSKDGKELSEPAVTIGYRYESVEKAPQVVLKQEGAHWNLWVDVDNEEHKQLAAEYELDQKLEQHQLYTDGDKIDEIMKTIAKSDSPRENFVSYDYTLFHNPDHQGSAYVSRANQIKLDEALAKKLQQEEYDAVKRGPGR